MTFKVVVSNGEDYQSSSQAETAWPAPVICMPYADYVVVDVDYDLLAAERPKYADAVIQTDRGHQWFYIGAANKADFAWIKAHYDSKHVERSADRGYWQIRTHSKRAPHIRRVMLPLTAEGQALADRFNATAEKQGNIMEVSQ